MHRYFTLLLLVLATTYCTTRASYLRGSGSEISVAAGVVGGSEYYNLQEVLGGSPAPPLPTASGENRDLTGALNNKEGSIQATMPTRSSNTGLAVGTPPLQTLQGQALGPAELPVLLPFASPYVSSP